jgi:hypothetical protein
VYLLQSRRKMTTQENGAGILNVSAVKDTHNGRIADRLLVGDEGVNGRVGEMHIFRETGCPVLRAG